MDAEDKSSVYEGPQTHKAARPMKVVVDEGGCTWLCDADVDESENLSEQGCWNCKDVAFTRND
jgi:hypothetical protein